MANVIEILNQTLFLKINGGNGTPAWLANAAIGIANSLIYLVALLLLWMWLWGDGERRQLAIKAALVAMLV